MITAPVQNPEVTFAERISRQLSESVFPPAVPATVMALDTVAREATADADAALKAGRYSDAAAAIGKVECARREIRDIFDAGRVGNDLTPILQCSAKWARIIEAFRAALKAQRGY